MLLRVFGVVLGCLRGFSALLRRWHCIGAAVLGGHCPESGTKLGKIRTTRLPQGSRKLHDRLRCRVRQQTQLDSVLKPRKKSNTTQTL